MLHQIAQDLWCADFDVKTAGVTFPGRMSVVRLPSRELVLYSPVPIDDALAAELEALGPVGFIVAPCGFHHLFAKKAKGRFPTARLLGSPILRTKRADIPLDQTLDEPAPDSWNGVVEVVYMRGAPKVDEVVLVHVPSKTLIVADLVFNIHNPVGAMSKMMFWMAGTLNKLAISRLYKSTIKDKAAMGESLDALLSLEFDRVVPCHGEIIETGARARVEPVLAGLR